MKVLPTSAKRSIPPWLVTGVAAILLGVASSSVAAQQPSPAAQQPGDKDEDDAKKKDADQGGKKVEVDPELRKRMDEILKGRGAGDSPQRRQPAAGGGAQKRRAQTPKPPSRSRSRRVQPQARQTAAPGAKPGATPPNDSTFLNIAATLDEVAPEARTYIFSIKDVSYEQLIEGFARQTGLGVIGDIPKAGKVSFVSTEELTFQEALGRVRMLLFRYKPHEPYWLVRRDTHLEVIRVTDFYRILSRDRMFSSIEALRAASLRDDELALVVFTPTSGSVADLRQVRDFLPDYVRIAPLENSNSITIFALIKDIDKYLGLIDFFKDSTSSDPRVIERIEIIHILPSAAFERLGRLMELGAAPASSAVRRTARQSRDANPLAVLKEPETVVIPDDARGILLVQAMQDKIEEIKRLLPYVDVELEVLDADPVIIPLKHATAELLIGTIRQVLSESNPPTTRARTSSTRRRTSRKGTAQPAKAAVTSDGVKMFAHPLQNAIVVLSDEVGVAKVRELVEQFDVPFKVGPIRLALAHAAPAGIASTITQLLSAGGGPKAGPAVPFQLIADPAAGGLWFSGKETDLSRVTDLIDLLDVPSDPVKLHTIKLEYQKPSFVVNMLKALEEEPSAGIAAAVKGAGRARKAVKRSRPTSASKFTPDDVNQRLYLLCTDDERDEYAALIAHLDVPPHDVPPLVSIAVEHIDPQEAIDQIGKTLGTSAPRDAAVRYVATAEGIVVVGATPRQLEHMRLLLAVIDKPVEIIERTFEIQHADVSLIKTALESLVGETVGAPGKVAHRRRGEGKAGTVRASVSDELTLVEVGNLLIVRTTPPKMEEVVRLVALLDVAEAEDETRIYGDFFPGTDLGALADSLAALMPGTSVRGSSPGGRGQNQPGGGPRFIPLHATGQLVIVARPVLFERIEYLLELLKTDIELKPINVVFLDVQYADPQDLVDQIQPLMELKSRELSQTEPAPGAAAPQTRRRGARSSPSGDDFHLAADVRNSRVVIAARETLIEHARELVAQFDRPYTPEVVFRTVVLRSATSAEMVKAIREVLGAKPGRPARKTPSAQAAAGAAEETPLSVVEAPGAGAVVLHGLVRDVEKAIVWIEHLDGIATTGKVVRTYEVKYADIKMLGDLIMNVVDRDGSPLGPKQRPRSRRPQVEVMEEEDPFELTKTWSGQEVYMRADLISRTLIVAASEVKLAKVDELIAQFDSEDAPSTGVPDVPKFLWDLRYMDPFEAEFALEAALDDLWPDPQKPQVSAAMFGDYLIVKYPDESRFDDIKEIIREYVDVQPEEERKFKTRSIPVPSGAGAIDLATWLKVEYPEYDFEIELPKMEGQKTFDLEVLKPPARDRGQRCVIPLALTRMVDGILAGSIAQQEESPANDDQESDARRRSTPPEDREDAGQPPARREGRDEALPPGVSREMIEAMIRSQMQAQKRDSLPAADSSGASKSDDKKKAKRPRAMAGEKIILSIDEHGNLTAHGPAGVLDDIPDWVDEFKEELEGRVFPPDIRIVRLRYVDVFYAAEILEEMFNATRQQRAVVNAAQRRAQQMAARQQQQQQRQQQQRQQQQQQAGQRGQPRTQQAQQQPGQIPQLPPTNVRVFPNARDRTLILRADANQYPAIFELLATIDQPKPIESELRIFTLTKLNASEVVEMLSDMLSLDERPATSASRRTSRGRRGTGGAAQSTSTGGKSLPRSVLQATIGGGNQLEVDPADISLIANDAANAIVAMAPQKALDFIGELIEQLESEDVPEREPRYYELQHADVEEVTAFLQARYEEGGGPGGRRVGKTSSKAGGDVLNTPSFIPYPRLKMLTVLATAKQLADIEELIERLDVKSEEEQWQYHTLVHCDARTVADTLGQMFGGSPKGGGGRQRRGTGSVGSSVAAAFIGEEGGRMLLYKAPVPLREPVKEAVAKLEADCANLSTVRLIKLEYANPSKLADAIDAAYGGGRGRGRGGSRGGGQTRFSVTADDASRMLFVVADNDTFAKVESLVKQLDKPGQIGFEFRIYPLKHADARKVHTLMSNLLKEYFQKLGAKRSNVEAFSVEVDERANALIVLGTPMVFGFLEENLAKVDTPANAASPRTSLAVNFKTARAEEVANTINQLYGRKGKQEVEDAVQAVANRTLNLLILTGTEEQIAEVRREVLDPLQRFDSDEGAGQHVRVISLVHADPDAIAGTLREIYIQSMPQQSGGLKPIAISALRDSKALLIKSNDDDFARIQETIAALDREGAGIGEEVRVVSLLYADAAEVEQAVRSYLTTPGGGRGAAKLVGDMRLSVLMQSNSLVVSGDKAGVERIEGLIGQLDQAGEKGSVPQIIKLQHADASQIVPTLQEVFSGQGSGRRRGQAAPVIVANEQLNAVIVRADPTELAAIEEMVSRLDNEEIAQASAYRLIKLGVAVNVEDMAGKIEESINEGAAARSVSGGRGREVPRITVTPDKQGGLLIVSGHSTLFDEAEKLARALEEMGPQGGKTTKIIRPKAPAEDIERLIALLKGEESSSRGRSSRSGSSRRGSSSRRKQPSKRRDR